MKKIRCGIINVSSSSFRLVRKKSHKHFQWKTYIWNNILFTHLHKSLYSTVGVTHIKWIDISNHTIILQMQIKKIMDECSFFHHLQLTNTVLPTLPSGRWVWKKVPQWLYPVCVKNSEISVFSLSKYTMWLGGFFLLMWYSFFSQPRASS